MFNPIVNRVLGFYVDVLAEHHIDLLQSSIETPEIRAYHTQ